MHYILANAIVAIKLTIRFICGLNCCCLYLLLAHHKHDIYNTNWKWLLNVNMFKLKNNNKKLKIPKEEGK